MKTSELFKSAALAAVAAAWACCTASGAWAANADALTVTLDVKPGVDPVTNLQTVSVSRTGLASNVSYKVLMVNGSLNTVNQVVFTGSSTADGSGIASYAAVVNLGLASPNCPPPGSVAAASVTCAIGQLKAGESREFFLIFQAPVDGTNIRFNGHTDFSQGNSSGTPPANFTLNVDNTIGLTTVDSTDVNRSVKTVLLPAGGTFFTGPNGQVNGANLVSTTVGVPTTALVTDNRIDQSALPSYACSGANPGYFCYGLSSSIQINNAGTGAKVYFTGSPVTIVLRQDAASLTVKKPTPGPYDVKLFYSATTGVGSEVPSCATTGGPTQDHPCVNTRRDFLKGKKGYYEYEILALDNGVFSW